MPRDPQGAETRVYCDGCGRFDVKTVRYRLSCDPKEWDPANYCASCAALDRKYGIRLTRVYPLPPHAGEETKG